MSSPLSQRIARRIRDGFGIRQCWGKKSYKSEREAWEAGKKYGQRAYTCQVCGWWHLTSKLR